MPRNDPTILVSIRIPRRLIVADDRIELTKDDIAAARARAQDIVIRGWNRYKWQSNRGARKRKKPDANGTA